MVIKASFDEDPRDFEAISRLYLCEFSDSLDESFSSKHKLDALSVFGVVNIDRVVCVVFVLSDESRLEAAHFVGIPVHQNHVGGAQRIHKLTGLRVINVRREGDVCDGHVEGEFVAHHGDDFLGFRQNLLGEGSIHAVASDDNPVFLICAPHFKELSGEAGLQHAWACHHHGGADIVKVLHAFQVGNVLEHKGVGDGKLAPDFLVHHVHIRLVDGDALFRQRGRIVDGDIVQFRMLLPVFVQDEQQFLRPPQRKHRDEASAPAVHNFLHGAREAAFAVRAGLVKLDAVGGFHDEHIGRDWGQFCGHQVAILFTGVVAGVEDADPCDFNHEHGGAEDVASMVGPELDAVNVN
eukprot:Sdes_comp20282_c0_seq2m13849